MQLLHLLSVELTNTSVMGCLLTKNLLVVELRSYFHLLTNIVNFHCCTVVDPVRLFLMSYHLSLIRPPPKWHSAVA